MKAELLILNGQVLEEKHWPDDYTPDAPATWRLADLFAKHHFLLNGLGFSRIGRPRPSIQQATNEVIR
jgi:hypothetical protein